MDIINWLCTPKLSKEFFDHYYEKKLLHLARTNSSYFDDILTKEMIDDFLSRNNHIYPAIRMSKDKQLLPISDFTTNQVRIGEGLVDGVVNMDKLFEQYQNGATIILENGEHYFHSMARFTNQLSDYLKLSTSGNIYITPPHSQGFAPHRDNTDVFILQIEGTKVWEFYNETTKLSLPTTQLDDVRDFPEEQPVKKIKLSAGSLLYIPRGIYHAASTEDDHSIHITISVALLRWTRVFGETFDQIDALREFRETVPLWEGKEKFRTLFYQKKQVLIDHLNQLDDWESLFALFQDNHQKQSTQINHRRFLSIYESSKLDLNSNVMLSEEINWKLQDQGTEIQLSFYDKQITFPNFVKPCIEFIGQQLSIMVKDLPDDLDEESKLVLVKKLLDEGWLRMN